MFKVVVIVILFASVTFTVTLESVDGRINKYLAKDVISRAYSIPEDNTKEDFWSRFSVIGSLCLFSALGGIMIASTEKKKAGGQQ